MTSVIINDIAPRTQAIATASQTVFSTNWTADVAADVVVYSRIAGSEPNDVADLLPSSAYTVAFIGASRIVQVTLITPSTAGDIVTITRATPVDRDNLYTNTNFTPTMLNGDFGRVTMMIQESDMYDQLLAPKYPNSAIVDDFDLVLPLLGPGESWVMSGDGDEILAAVAGSSGDIFAQLASHDPGEGASLIGLEGTGTVQDLANAKFILQTANTAAPNAQSLGALTTGILKSTTTSGILSISAPLTSIDALTTAADKMIYTTASNVYAVTDLSAFARTLLDDTTAGQMATTLGVLQLSGGTMTGSINMGTNQITNMGNGVNPQDAATIANITGTLSGYLPLAGGTMAANTGVINMNNSKIIGLATPTNSGDAVNKAYADSIASGLTVQEACRLTTTGALTATYDNGASGIGATLTNSGALAALSLDGVAVNTNDRVLVRNQASTLENGIYDVTNAGSGVVAWILTRSSDYNQPSQMQPGDLVIINEGDDYAGTSFIETVTVTAVGTDPILFSQFTYSATQVLLKANNLNDVASVTDAFNNISPLTTKGDLIAFDGSDNVRLAVGGSDGQLLRVKSAATNGFDWSITTYPDTTTINRILFSSANNTVSEITTANSAMIRTDSSGVPGWSASMTDGQFMIGVTAGTPIPGTITAGSGISVTNSAGGITIAATGTASAGGFTRIFAMMGA